MCTPSRRPAPPAHFTQRRSSCKAGADHQARWAGVRGGEGCELEVLERRWRGLGLEVAYRRRGEREARLGPQGEQDVDMGRRWRAWQRTGEREQPWRGLGVEDAYRRRRKQEARCCLQGEADADMGQRWRVPDVLALGVRAGSPGYVVYDGLVEAVAWGGQVLEDFDGELGPALL